jgi:hypothetical protein
MSSTASRPKTRPHVVFPLGVTVTPVGVITAPVAVLFLAAEETEQEEDHEARPARPGLAKTLPSNGVVLRRRVA